jgi:hypothetical protein
MTNKTTGKDKGMIRKGYNQRNLDYYIDWYFDIGDGFGAWTLYRPDDWMMNETDAHIIPIKWNETEKVFDKPSPLV